MPSGQPCQERFQRMENAASVLNKVAQRCHELGIGCVLDNKLAESLQAISERLAQSSDVSSADDAANGIFIGAALDHPKFVALFPGQRSQRLNMGGHLFRVNRLSVKCTNRLAAN